VVVLVVDHAELSGGHTMDGLLGGYSESVYLVDVVEWLEGGLEHIGCVAYLDGDARG